MGDRSTKPLPAHQPAAPSRSRPGGACELGGAPVSLLLAAQLPSRRLRPRTQAAAGAAASAARSVQGSSRPGTGSTPPPCRRTRVRSMSAISGACRPGSCRSSPHHLLPLGCRAWAGPQCPRVGPWGALRNLAAPAVPSSRPGPTHLWRRRQRCRRSAVVRSGCCAGILFQLIPELVQSRHTAARGSRWASEARCLAEFLPPHRLLLSDHPPAAASRRRPPLQAREERTGAGERTTTTTSASWCSRRTGRVSQPALGGQPWSAGKAVLGGTGAAFVCMRGAIRRERRLPVSLISCGGTAEVSRQLASDFPCAVLPCPTLLPLPCLPRPACPAPACPCPLQSTPRCCACWAMGALRLTAWTAPSGCVTSAAR
jgi:hypothetical protein